MMAIWGRRWEPEMWQLSKYSTDEAKRLITSLPKFAVVRNPLNRIVSAWRDKFGPNTKNDSLTEKRTFFVSELKNSILYNV